MKSAAQGQRDERGRNVYECARCGMGLTGKTGDRMPGPHVCADWPACNRRAAVVQAEADRQFAAYQEAEAIIEDRYSGG